MNRHVGPGAAVFLVAGCVDQQLPTETEIVVPLSAKEAAQPEEAMLKCISART